ncbi:hypothetical protein [Crossiella cryophila]|uniref:Small-conductance mechanosensitive channel n=1 Tax=Crossiella cryophila TaxID=43355 RepID=A0A7W7FX75_9PSEU|nr:hypothetical protein [Crossiella cryophila]MBB4682326.1 small-conductance mechanosensitive channel [Crossiella cryophila]
MSEEVQVNWVEPKTRPTILVVGGLAVAVAVVGWFVVGPLGALSSLTGALITVLFFFTGAWVVSRVARHMPEMVLAVGLASYIFRLLAVLGTLFLLRAVGLTPTWIAVGVVAAVLGWVVSMTVTVVRMRPGLGGVRPGSGK